ncbi:hypothetical protein PVAP13_9NG172700 [Panicum virgatum]|uniref:Bifunctional inhibitor/plant lipid transfer protein/seed storage helical domain-containing protein n=1 Tax=Panicum virgatum TaxID=38727 RepID=A0A8T0MIQ5_PANVG|nr:hypothetical protein PVAP13_9NG172700 [Panicum virgatum]
MERSRGQHQLLTIFLLVLLSAACVAGVDPPCKPWDPCDSQLLSWMIGRFCVGDLEHPTETCCEGVVAAVGIRFGDTVEVPCLCRVAKEPYLGIMGLDIHSILRMYPTCDGVQPVGPHTAEACNGRV